MKCPKCKGEMEEGNYVSKSGAIVEISNRITWVSGLRWNFLTGFKFDKEKKVKAYCCKECGYLESYAK